MGLAVTYFPRHFVLVAGCFEVMALLGGAAGDIWLEPLIANEGWRAAMQVCSLLMLLLFVGVVLFVKIPKRSIDRQDYPLLTVRVYCLQVKQLFTNFWVWRSCLYGGFLFAIINTFASLWSVHFLRVQYPSNLSFAAPATGWIFIGGAVGTLFVGVLYRYLSVAIVMRTFSLIAFIAFLLVAWGESSYASIKFFLFILGFSTGAYILAFEDIKNRVPEGVQNTALGLTNMIILLFSGPVMQPLIGELFDLVDRGGKEVYAGVGYWVALLPLLVGLLLAIGLSFIRPCKDNDENYLSEPAS